MPEIILYVLLAVVLAIAIDFGLIRWLRRRWKADDTGPQVRLFGAYSPVLTWLRYRRLPAAISEARSWTWPEFGWGRYLVEWLIIMAVASLYGEDALLDFDARQLQQTGEHNESATLPLLADVSLRRYGEIPLWNPYMLTGFPHAGDFVNHFWNPVSTIPIWLWGGINGMKASVFISFALAGIGEWLFAHVFGGRGFIRLWAGILFMISGGLAMLWRVGWYELLLGMAWFPWCFASFWWAVRRRDRASLALAAICVAMVLTAGGGYYPFYLLVSLSALMIVALLSSHRADRWPKAQRAIAVAALGVGLAAVTLLPLADGYRYTVRDAGQDLDQRFSQPIRYALINYVVSQPAWFNTEILGSAGGWNWFYIGFLPVLAALSLTPLALSRRHRRPALIGVAVLALVILAWHASKFAPVKYIYDWVPFLYTFRFPNRLLVLATSPLIVLGGIGLQSLLLDLRRWGRGFVAVVSRKDGGPAITGVSIKHILDVALIVVLVLTLRDVYSINKVFAFAPRPRNPKPNTALTWLKNYDPDLYYTNIGGRTIYWDWTPAAYEMEMPIINFEYGRHVATSDQQHGEGSPFVATPKYMLALPDQPRPENAEMIHDFDGVGLWYLPDALPFAFSAAPAELQPYASLNRQDASALKARLDGPNRVVVTGAPGTAGDQLVVLVSDYPGWHLFVDGRPAQIQSANYYLGAVMPPGEHTYTFVFSPTSHYAGLGISLLSLLIALGLMWADSSFRLARSRLEAAIAQSPSASSAD